MSYGTLFLLPCPLGDTPAEQVLPPQVVSVARRLRHFVVEEAKTTRQFLAALKHEQPIQSLHFATLNEHTPASELPALLQPLLAGEDVGIVSEAGCPGVADPGAQLVALAHRHGVRVVPLVGPSSILLALMASGLNGQCFAFHGYLPVEEAARKKSLQQLETESFKRRQTQLFIETPYRNDKLLQALLTLCRPSTQICIAADLTLPTETILTRSVADWRKAELPKLHKRPCLFLLLA